MSELILGVNIDHVATLREARYATMPNSQNVEPDPVSAAMICERAGARGITAHLRSDRRHIQERDIRRLREVVMTKLNIELGNTKEILDIVLEIEPEDVCLVPENRREITTEGGLNVVRNQKALAPTIERLQTAGIRVSLFIEPDAEQIEASVDLGAQAIELHTGVFANAVGDAQDEELKQLTAAAAYANDLGLQVNAGHGINYENVGKILTMPCLCELNIGHSIVSRALTVGMEKAVREMVAALSNYVGE